MDAGLVRDIDLDGKCLEVCILRVLLTFLRSLLGALLVQIRKGNALYTGLCKRKSSLFADSGRGLLVREVSLGQETTSERLGRRTPVMRAKPVVSIVLDAIEVLNVSSQVKSNTFGCVVCLWVWPGKSVSSAAWESTELSTLADPGRTLKTAWGSEIYRATSIAY